MKTLLDTIQSALRDAEAFDEEGTALVLHECVRDFLAQKVQVAILDENLEPKSVSSALSKLWLSIFPPKH